MRVAAAAAAAALLAGAAHALEITLATVQFLEQQPVVLPLAPTERAPAAEVRALVESRGARTAVDVTFKRLRPAVLFGGDVTSYVAWVVTREGKVERLGELWSREENGTAALATGLKEFALIVTVETHPMVERPCELVAFVAQPPANPRGGRVASVSYAGFAPAPAHAVESLAAGGVVTATPAELAQAEKVLELAQRGGAGDYAPGLVEEAVRSLAQARALAGASGRRKEMADVSRRTVSLASEAIAVTRRRLAEKELEARIAARQAETEALEARARAAEESAAAAAAGLERARALKAAMDAELARLREEKATLESATVALEGEKALLQAQRAELAQRLEGALSRVAETRSSARGFIVNLPDILFDSGEATLKPAAQLTVAKLSGILLLMPELRVRIEGHTDSTGAAARNAALSQRRADAVRAFLAEQGIAEERMKAAGYGMERPVADNATAAGRARNRRVELVIGEGALAEPQAEER
jgi:outer membrane protein OmpA-like peptidoglycan-associated protein